VSGVYMDAFSDCSALFPSRIHEMLFNWHAVRLIPIEWKLKVSRAIQRDIPYFSHIIIIFSIIFHLLFREIRSYWVFSIVQYNSKHFEEWVYHQYGWGQFQCQIQKITFWGEHWQLRDLNAPAKITKSGITGHGWEQLYTFCESTNCVQRSKKVSHSSKKVERSRRTRVWYAKVKNGKSDIISSQGQ
jgi:hypothetical protein